MSDLTLHNENQLLGLIATGDEIAFAQIFEYYRDRIYSVAFKLTKSNVIAEEIVQDVFLKIWKKRADLIEIQNFSAYLFVVTRNHVYKILKRIASNYTTSLLTDEDIPAPTTDLIIEKEYKLVLQQAISRLPGQQKLVYYLVKDQGLKRTEVAEQLRIQPETVKFYLAEAMKNIRAFCKLYLFTIIGFTILLSRF
ncbi:MAG: sigma-70 family RNA polymerase sigma factor [Ginsengibacter sp.]